MGIKEMSTRMQNGVCGFSGSKTSTLRIVAGVKVDNG